MTTHLYLDNGQRFTLLPFDELPPEVGRQIEDMRISFPGGLVPIRVEDEPTPSWVIVPLNRIAFIRMRP